MKTNALRFYILIIFVLSPSFSLGFERLSRPFDSSVCAAVLMTMGSLSHWSAQEQTTIAVQSMWDFRWDTLNFQRNDVWSEKTAYGFFSAKENDGQTTQSKKSTDRIALRIVGIQKDLRTGIETKPGEEAVIGGIHLVGDRQIDNFLSPFKNDLERVNKAALAERKSIYKNILKKTAFYTAIFVGGSIVANNSYLRETPLGLIGALAAFQGLFTLPPTWTMSILAPAFWASKIEFKFKSKNRKFEEILKARREGSWFYDSASFYVNKEFQHLWSSPEAFDHAIYNQASLDISSDNDEGMCLHFDKLLTFKKDDEGQFVPVLDIIVRFKHEVPSISAPSKERTKVYVPQGEMIPIPIPVSAR
jgi:hypothetical protein